MGSVQLSFGSWEYDQIVVFQAKRARLRFQNLAQRSALVISFSGLFGNFVRTWKLAGFDQIAKGLTFGLAVFTFGFGQSFFDLRFVRFVLLLQLTSHGNAIVVSLFLILVRMADCASQFAVSPMLFRKVWIFVELRTSLYFGRASALPPVTSNIDAARTPATTKRTQFFTVSIKTSGKFFDATPCHLRSAPFFGEADQEINTPYKDCSAF
jgi:hypothetical protein